ncbi:MAG: hypothetical protein EBQ92_00050 [Proteobacteria bacterium]|jgi:hypothetical protein|nr:hypothetical protein [Pseudomonadota bacterium]
MNLKKSLSQLLLLFTGLLLVGCTKEAPNPRLEQLKSQASQLHQKQVELEEAIKKAGETDSGKTTFLTHDLELLKSRLLRLKEEAKVLNGGVEVPLGPASASAGGH